MIIGDTAVPKNNKKVLTERKNPLFSLVNKPILEIKLGTANETHVTNKTLNVPIIRMFSESPSRIKKTLPNNKAKNKTVLTL